MNVNKTIKKIVSVAVGTAMLGSTLFGAVATLEQFPQPFVKDGVADVQFVIGSGSTDDYLGVLDIATSLQASAVTTVAVAGTGSTAKVEGGVKVESAGNALLLTENLSSAKASLDDGDLPKLLGDGTLTEEDDSTDYDYTQKLTLSNETTVEYNADDSDMKDPILYLNTASADFLWQYDLDFKGAEVNISQFTDSEGFDMLGKKFTIDSDNALGQEIKLYGAESTSFLELNTPKTLTVEGKTYTVEIVGANSEASAGETIILDVNGVRKTLNEGDSTTVNGLDVYVKDLFVTNIPTLSASANIFVGSEEVLLPVAAAAETYSVVEINSNSANGLEAWVEGADNNQIEAIHFRLIPADLDADDGFDLDETNFIKSGDSLADPLFDTVKVLFQGSNYAMDDKAKNMVKIMGGDDELSVSFTNDDGDSLTFKPFKWDSGSQIDDKFAVDGDGFGGIVAAAGNISDKQVFILNEGTTTKNTIAFEVSGWKTSDNEVKIKNLMSGETKDYAETAELIDGVTIDDIDVTTKKIQLSDATEDILYLKGGYQEVRLNSAAANSTAVVLNMTIVEDNTDEADDSTVTIMLSEDTDGDKFDVASDVTAGTSDGDNSDDNNVNYALTQFGTYVVSDIDEYDSVVAYVPVDEDGMVSYNVFVAPTTASVETTVSGTTTQKVNPIAVGVAMKDSEVNVANPAHNLIVVGGTCINSVSAKLKGVAEKTCGEASGLKAGQATIELFNLDNGKVAMLVAGWEATETQAGARAVASKAAGLKGNKVTLSVTSASQYTIQ